MGLRKSWAGRLVAIAASVFVAGASLAAVPVAAQTQDCPSVMPVADVRKGMTGTGRTVASDRTITTFTVEILGVIPDGIGPGRDMIIVEADSPEIQEAGGIWFGMSGSPVYIDGKLVGAVAFGLSAGPSSIGGLTPAENMMQVLDYPTPGPTHTFSSRSRIPERMRPAIAQRAGMSEAEVTGMRVLKLPLAMSGINDRALRYATSAISSERLNLMPYAAGSAGTTVRQGSSTLEAGSSLAGALSYGDITSAGVGTTTFTCNGRAMGFGHPFLWSGNKILGANAADAVTIVDDPLFGPYKLATIGEGIGVIDQDRFAGIRVALGSAPPPTIPVTSSIFSSGTGVTRDGRTDVVLPEAMPFLAFIHALVNIDFTIDRIGEGSSGLTYTISGLREDGTPFEVVRSNLYTSDFDISSESVFELLSDLFTIESNPFEDVTFTGIDVNATVDDAPRLYEIDDVLVSVGRGEYRDVRKVRARRGQRIGLRVSLSPRGEPDVVTVDLSLRVPQRARGEGFIDVAGGGSFGGGECFFEGGDCVGPSGKIDDFDELLASMADRPRSNELLARLFTRGRNPKSEDSFLLDRVVSGFGFVRVIIEDGCCGGETSLPSKPRQDRRG